MYVEDVAYANLEKSQLLMRLYFPSSPIGQGIVMVHGGAWTANDRMTPHVLNTALAERGLLVGSLDFRCGPEFQHPTASSDIAAGIRFFRGNAQKWGIDSAKIGLIGSSSGGHLVLFTALQPNALMHRQTPHIEAEDSASQDASVAYVIALWPVSDPLYRYRHAIETKRPELVAAHDGFFQDTDQMHAASVPRVLQDGEHTHLPPLLVIQPGLDANVPQEMTLNLIRQYQQVQGRISYRFMPNLPHAFAYEASPETTNCERTIWQFIQAELG